MGFFRRKKSTVSNNGSSKSTTADAAAKAKKKQQPRKPKKHVHFTDIKPIHHDYEFDWSLEGEYWFSKAELKKFNEVRFDEADVLRKERGIRTSSRNDAEGIEGDSRDHFIGDALTHALDDDNDAHEISLWGIEHFVWPVLQKEMVSRKKVLKKVVIEWRIPVNRRKDPNGLKLAEDVAELSKWARDVATERGIKYCEMKRGGGLLKNTRGMMMGKSGRKNQLSMMLKAGNGEQDFGSAHKNKIYGKRD